MNACNVYVGTKEAGRAATALATMQLVWPACIEAARHGGTNV